MLIYLTFSFGFEVVFRDDLVVFLLWFFDLFTWALLSVLRGLGVSCVYWFILLPFVFTLIWFVCLFDFWV